MKWWIFIVFYLIRNSLRRWREQPLSLLGKVVVACLVSLFGAVVMLGIGEMGRQLDKHLHDRDVLLALISERVSLEQAALDLTTQVERVPEWETLGCKVYDVLQLGAMAELNNRKQYQLFALRDIERFGMLDEFHLFTDSRGIPPVVEFEVQKQRSEAVVERHTDFSKLLSQGRDILVGSEERLAPLLASGYTRLTVVEASQVEDLAKIESIAAALTREENRRVIVQSNYLILKELKDLRNMQSRAMLVVTGFSAVVLGLVFGGLAWLEYREERFLLALIRSFGVRRGMLLGHALLENCLLACAGVGLAVLLVAKVAPMLDLGALGLPWISEGHWWQPFPVLLAGAVVGGVLSCVPVAFGLRKELGLVLK